MFGKLAKKTVQQIDLLKIIYLFVKKNKLSVNCYEYKITNHNFIQVNLHIKHPEK